MIAAYFDNHDEILQVAITLDHDHTRLKVPVERFGACSSLPDPKKETESDDTGSS